ncbi:MAG: cyclase family protein [Chloroflexia bacterium]|nr:cyclase family protein [Chloroflexia bacterium]MDQ3410956.1 cyclase family protein [Chloroflexota bacterium]
MATLVDLSHPLVSGQHTYPWLPAPEVTEFLSRDASRARYAAGTEFAIHQVLLIGNSGTYIDSPFHRFADGVDLADLPLERMADLPGTRIDVSVGPERTIEPSLLAGHDATLIGGAVLFQTGWDNKWRTAAYPTGAPFITRATAQALVDCGVWLVGIDALNADDTDDPARPAHSLLLDAGIPIVENLSGLDRLPATGFRFFAVPAPVQGCGSFPVRAFAIV